MTADPPPRRSTLPTLRETAAVLVLLLLAPASARGNMAEPRETGPAFAGRVAGEPAGGLRSVLVERERLRIDLRPLAREDGLAEVEAVYRLRNDGPARDLELVFVADGLAAGEHGVWLDGRPVPAAPGPAGALPAGWRAPASTPAPEGGGALPYETQGAGALRFRLALPPGRHEVRVRYPAAASAYAVAGELTAYRQLAYVLAPARDWGGFGGLDVRVELPRGWRAAARPALRRDGDALAGAWDRVPADALAVTVRPPDPARGLYWGGYGLLALAGLCLLWRAGRPMGRALARRGRRSGWALLPALGLAFAWGVAVVVGLAAVPDLIRKAAGPFADSQYGYGLVFMGIILFPLLLLAGAGAVQAGAVLGHRRARAETALTGRPTT